MENYTAKCPSCGQKLTIGKTLLDGAVIFAAQCNCPNCGKKYTAEFDKLYQIDEPELFEIGADGYDKDGFDAEGYNKDGISERGFDRNHICVETSSPYNSAGFDWEGYNADGLDERGFDRDGFYKHSTSKYNEEGYDWHGYNASGYNQYGVDKYGKDPNGFTLEELAAAEKKRSTRRTLALLAICIVAITIYYLIKY